MKARPALVLGLLLVTLVPVSAQNLPVEVGPANAPDQRPQFPGQTRAPQPDAVPPIATEVVASGLPQLWSMEFLPDGRMLVTAKNGALHVIGPDGKTGPAIAGVPKVDSRGQGGLLDLALAPDFASSGRIFLSFAEPRNGGNGTSVASAVLVLDDGGGRLADATVIFRQLPTFAGNLHFGSRLVFGPQGELFVTVGERSDASVRDQAQDLASGLGKTFRIDQTGVAWPGNPFIGTPGALPQIWSLGHRNMQAAALDSKGRLWTVEHGPRGGDELNLPQAGKNYGWPDVTYGIAYSGAPIGRGLTVSEATEQPVYYWDPVIAPSGMAFYQGAEFPEWRDAVLIGGLASRALVVVHLKDDRVIFEERVPIGARVRDVRVGPDGAVFLVTETRSGSSEILRLTRAD